ncbi:short-chain dehydrogenase TIC 32, chloroplastic-like isoform X6 [Nymphaea colorata]|uniref:short-chain dehydrogenase TIC 32, chloroplastic-like isoform X6 n=1 Tax=Nymphaea colorata TaxID=210225 RepID=UPI00214F180C|nr:short-chain dehydrogenase TIC 32, chloroplastic-like isoform X6 [Nymphaea colorata]
MERLWSWVCRKKSSGFGACSTAEEVTEGIDASNITTIVTGATSGIGMETARVLALRGATVIIAARSKVRGEKAKVKIAEEVADAKIEVMELDLSSLASVRSFAAAFLSSNKPLHLLINNAGIFGYPFQLSADGIELQFASNHIGHFLLTNLLLEKMKATALESGIEGRIVIVSSAGHSMTYKSGIRFKNINNPSGHVRFKAYGQSKLANILHAKELARCLQEEGVKVTANSLHPGAIPTNIAQYYIKNIAPLAPLIFILRPFLKTVQQGAATTCYLALHPNMEGVSGKYFSDCNEDQPSAYGRDADLAKGLWEFSEEMTSTKLPQK